MEIKVTENGQAKVNTVKADKTPKFVAGNPVNEVLKKVKKAKQRTQSHRQHLKCQRSSRQKQRLKAISSWKSLL
ncbi:MAG: hypothetical protein WKF66_07850 [Pedobacter sp.]